MFTQQQLEEIDRLLRSGMSRADVAAHLGMARQTMELRIARSGKSVVQCLVDLDTIRDTEEQPHAAAA